MVSNIVDKVKRAGLVKPMLWGSSALLPFGIDVSRKQYMVLIPTGVPFRKIEGLTIVVDSDLYYTVEQISFEDKRMEDVFCIPCPSALNATHFDNITNAHLRALQRSCKQLKHTT